MSRKPLHDLRYRPNAIQRWATTRIAPSRRTVTSGLRARGVEYDGRQPFLAPEDWHEPSDEGPTPYRIIVREPGPGYCHVVTPDEIRARLAQLPSHWLRSLEVVQLCRMTRKKRLFPCYGMQWGQAIYLYPVSEELVEHFFGPPSPAQRIEAAMYGGRWEPASDGTWRLTWTAEAVKDYYLNNILIHELGHLVDNRNRRTVDRERFAEWFAIQYGYKPSRRVAARAKPVRRHDAQAH